MKRLLDDYVFDERMRYESHMLIYVPEGGMELRIGGITGAAVLVALLATTDEGDARGIALESDEQRKEFYRRYEVEVRRDNGGLFRTEVQALSDSYIEFTGEDNTLYRLCAHNDRLYDLAVGLIVEYMQRLVREEAEGHIYDAVEWRQPFCEWLYDAAFVETRRQRLFSIDWTDAAEVCTFAEALRTGEEEETDTPTFLFEGLSADQLIRSYYEWLHLQMQQAVSVYPDSAAQMAKLRPEILRQETDDRFLHARIARLSPENINLFHRWMNKWRDFITGQLGTSEPVSMSKRTPSQELFLDAVLPVPKENSYVSVREYIQERCRYDETFRTYYTTRTLTRFCEQLTILFGWYVNPNHLGKRLKNTKK